VSQQVRKRPGYRSMTQTSDDAGFHAVARRTLDFDCPSGRVWDDAQPAAGVNGRFEP
jgi:hypothetical protein